MSIAPLFAVPDGWTAIPRAAFEQRSFPGAGRVQHVIGWEITRDACGCEIVLGMRLDKREPTSGLRPCPAHEDEVALALHALQTMPGQDVEFVSLAADMVEQAIAS